MREDHDYYSAPSQIRSFRTLEPSVNYDSLSGKRSRTNLWNSPYKSSNKIPAKNTIKPKKCSMLMFIIPTITALLAAAVTTGIYGMVALITRQAINNTVIIEMPTGTILLYGGNASSLSYLDTRWLFCNGSEVSRTTYHVLYAVIGTMYGVGNGVTTFNLPDFRTRFPLGSNGINDTSFARGGNLTHTITVSELPPHTHDQGTLQTQTDGVHSHTYTDPGHDHTGATAAAYAPAYGYGAVWNGQYGFTMTTHAHGIYADVVGITIQNSVGHTHTITGSTGSEGQGQAFSMMPPYQTVHYIIRA